MPDTTEQERQVVAELLVTNRQLREQRSAELAAAKDELRGLLFRAQRAEMEVANMATHAGISRDTAHAILKEGGVMSWKQKQTWAGQVLALVQKGTFEDNMFRMFVQMHLYKALGSNPEDVPRSVQGVINAATQTMRTTAGRPDFTPKIIDPERLRTFMWPEDPFEIFQRGKGTKATFHVRQGGIEVAPWRSSADDVARDLKALAGDRPAFIDRTGPECVTSDGRRIGWDVLGDV